MPEELDKTPVSALQGVGPAMVQKLGRVGIHTLADVLFHLPARYEDRTRITPIGLVRQGERVVLEGRLAKVDIAYGRRRSLVCMLLDDSGSISLRFFHFSRAQQHNLERAARIRCFGEVRRGASGLEIYHPEYQVIDKPQPLGESLTPVYPLTEGLTQTRIRALVDQVLAMMDEGRLLTELLPAEFRHQGIGINEAVKRLHNPAPSEDVEGLMMGTHPVQQRLVFEELLAQRTGLRLARETARTLESYCLEPPGDDFEALKSSLGFTLTGAQRRVAAEIAADMSRSHPMLRLLQGDVGSGKTVVAALASMHAAQNRLQTAIMAPTEILAEQHFISFSRWLLPLGTTMAFLTGRVKGKKRAEQLELIASGSASVVVGTHALFQEDVSFSNLGLVIIDEQHRFGVHQRLALREKGSLQPHQLVMTATPIPRTLTMSLYADMDCSMIDELPPGRLPVTTSVLPDTRREEVIQRVRSACGSGRQAYWVCTLIEESEVLQCQAAEVTAAQLADSLPDLSIGLIHGRMSAARKTEVMNHFKEGRSDLLVATTVIEVGVDVPNASLMIIENPERLGLAQLHQLRGRVGRSTTESHCLLLFHPPLGEISRARLNVLRESHDGFVIAEEDLRIRGPGEVLGSRQSGSLQFKLADLARDRHLLPEVARLSETLIRQDPQTARRIVDRWVSLPGELGQV